MLLKKNIYIYLFKISQFHFVSSLTLARLTIDGTHKSSDELRKYNSKFTRIENKTDPDSILNVHITTQYQIGKTQNSKVKNKKRKQKRLEKKGLTNAVKLNPPPSIDLPLCECLLNYCF